MTDRTTNVRRALIQQLESFQRAGLRHLPRVEVAPLPRIPEVTPQISEPANVAPEPPTKEEPAMTAQDIAHDQAAALQVLQQEVAGCTLCQELASTRKQTVFGVGNPNARVLFFGEAPGADEDRQGEPFVGRAGQLLTKIIVACTWEREDVYILNTLKCRPPGNRNPADEERSNCRPYWQQQLQIIKPEYIVCLGKFAMVELLETAPTQAIGRMRHKFHQYDSGDVNAKVVVTYHPSYLLRNPAAKKDVWDDMKMLMADMGIEIPRKS